MRLLQTLRFAAIVQSKSESTLVRGGYMLAAWSDEIKCQHTPMSQKAVIEMTGLSIDRPSLGFCSLADADKIPFPSLAEDQDTGELFLLHAPVQKFRAAQDTNHAEFILDRLLLEGTQ